MKGLIFIFYLLILTFGCKKEEKINPFDLPENKEPIANNPVIIIDANSFAGIHKNIFKPTCANSGCHDGTFEPDFRTVESSYNTLVLQPIIKNDVAGSFQFRVKPGDAAASVIINRLTVDIDGLSGIMPLGLSPGSDWESKKDGYIENIRNWIINGAKDVFGNSPVGTNLPPQLTGILITETGSSNALPRNIQSGSIQVPTNATSIDVYLAFTDDQTPINDITYLKVKTGASMNMFEGLQEISLTPVNPISGIGYSGNQIQFTHKFSISVGGLPPAQAQFIRAYLQDNLPTFTELPSTSSAEHIKRYYSFQKGE
jgi:hypothetical protein